MNRPISNLSLLGISFIIYLSLWSFANWPALNEAWWSTDDYFFMEQVGKSNYPSFSGLTTGRPVCFFWYETFLLENNSSREIYNVLLRFIQGAIHCSAAILAAILIYQSTNRWTAFLSTLPFLLWPFNGEAVLWRAAGYYPLAALFGLVGVYVIWQSKGKNNSRLLAGCLCIVLAVLTNQVAGLSGLILWVILITLSILDDTPTASEHRKLYFRTSLIVSVYLLAGFLSYFIANYFSALDESRAIFTSHYVEKLLYLSRLNYDLLFYPRYYPFWLRLLMVMLIMIYGLVFLETCIRQKCSIKRVILFALFPITLFVIPYAPLLLVSENSTSPRLLYIAPLSITGLWVVLDRSMGNRIFARMTLLVILIFIVLGYVSIARVSSSEYVESFNEDLRVLNIIRNYGSSIKKEELQVSVVTPPNFIRDWNPYNLKYMNGDSKRSAYLTSWSAAPFVRLFSGLATTDNDSIRHNCLLHCQQTRNGKKFQIFELQGDETLCVCP